MFYKKIPEAGMWKKYSNKKYKNPRSDQICKVLIASNRKSSVHNCLVEFFDGYKIITSKWNLF